MCRLIAYQGPSVRLEDIVIRPSHSLIVQSQVAEEAKLAVNGDGFGLAWYANHNRFRGDITESSCGTGEGAAQAALYKEIMPAWANPNLLNLCRAIHAPSFITHVRASTFGGATYQNCHPFTHGSWSFAHNGQIGGFEKLRRPLENLLPDHLFRQRLGITDSELLFLLIMSLGLDEDQPDHPSVACERAIRLIENLRTDHQCRQPLRLTFVMSNGKVTNGCRYSSDGNAPTLYLSKPDCCTGRILASEPLDGDHCNWRMVSEGEFVEISADRVTIRELNYFPALR
ncbi:MAG: class II glutamine amidotransferase [Rhizobiaceae bacterium]